MRTYRNLLEYESLVLHHVERLKEQCMLFGCFTKWPYAHMARKASCAVYILCFIAQKARILPTQSREVPESTADLAYKEMALCSEKTAFLSNNSHVLSNTDRHT